jgi:LysM repeat protein
VKPAPADSGWYVVQAGDILGRIAQKHGVSRQAILDANPSIKDPNKLKIGQKIKIPPRGTGITDKPKTAKKAATATKAKKTLPAKDGYIVYTVKKGDILGRIAKANKTTQKAILEANNLADANRIIEGQPLYIPAPGAKAEAAEAPAPKAAEKKTGKTGKTVKVIDDSAVPESDDDILKGFDSND